MNSSAGRSGQLRHGVVEHLLQRRRGDLDVPAHAVGVGLDPGMFGHACLLVLCVLPPERQRGGPLEPISTAARDCQCELLRAGRRAARVYPPMAAPMRRTHPRRSCWHAQQAESSKSKRRPRCALSRFRRCRWPFSAASRQGRRRPVDAHDAARQPGGPKQELAAKGVDLDFDITQFVQGLQNSGEGWPNGGKVDLRFRLDGQKLGPVAGFFVTGHVEYNYGSNANQDARRAEHHRRQHRAGLPVAERQHVLAAVHAGLQPDDRRVTLGLFNMLDAASRRPLDGGGGIDGFWNLADGGAADQHHAALHLRHLVQHAHRRRRLLRPVHLRRARRAEPEHRARPVFGRRGLQRHRQLPGDDGGLGGFQICAWPTARATASTCRRCRRASAALQYKTDRWYLQYSFEQFLVQDAHDPKLGWGCRPVRYSDGTRMPSRRTASSACRATT